MYYFTKLCSKAHVGNKTLNGNYKQSILRNTTPSEHKVYTRTETN